MSSLFYNICIFLKINMCNTCCMMSSYSRTFYNVLCAMWSCDNVIITCDIMLISNPKFPIRKQMKNKNKKIKKEMKINKVYHLEFWHYPSFNVSSPEKLTFIFASFSLASSSIHPQTFHHLIHTTSLQYIFLVAFPS